MTKINIIELYPKYTNCFICNKGTLLRFFIPMYENKKVDTTKTDEWAGIPVCKECYENKK